MARAVPILPSRDLRATLRFYERLGFENVGAPPEEWDYLIIMRDGAEIHFIGVERQIHQASASSCFLFVADADALYEEWHKPEVVPHEEWTGSRLEAPIDTDYGMREFAVVDPSGNLVRVGSPLPTTS